MPHTKTRGESRKKGQILQFLLIVEIYLNFESDSWKVVNVVVERVLIRVEIVFFLAIFSTSRKSGCLIYYRTAVTTKSTHVLSSASVPTFASPNHT